MHRNLSMTEPPAALEAGVRELVRSLAARSSGDGDAEPSIALHSWKPRYWSFLRRVTVTHGNNAPLQLWLKIPKRDPACRDLARVLEDPSQRQAAREEAQAYLDLARVFEAKDSKGPVSFVKVLDWRPEWSLIVTQHEDLPPLTPVLRRAKRNVHGREWDHARGAVQRAGLFLLRAHEGVPSQSASRESCRDRCLNRFDHLLSSLERDYPRWRILERIRGQSDAIRSALRSGYEQRIPIVATHRGVDARNLLDDGTRQVWLDPEARTDDVAYHDLARMIATLGMIDYGGVRGFVPPTLPRPWIDSLLEGYGRPSWLEPRTLSAFILYWLLDRFDDSHRMLLVQPWGSAVRGLLDAFYTRRFYGSLLADSLQEGPFIESI